MSDRTANRPTLPRHEGIIVRVADHSSIKMVVIRKADGTLSHCHFDCTTFRHMLAEQQGRLLRRRVAIVGLLGEQCMIFLDDEDA